MNDIKKPFPPHISYSGWMEARNVCQWKWKLNNIDGYKKSIYGINLDFGTAMHEVIEVFYCKTPEPSNTSDILKFLFAEKLRWLFNTNVQHYRENEKKTDIELLVRAGQFIIDKFYECGELATAKVMFNELALFEKIGRSDDLDISFKGFIDVVIKTKDGRGKDVLYVCDFKTCQWGWDIEKKQDRDKQFQILLYKHFFCKKYGLDPKLVRTAFVLLKKRPRKDDCPVEFLPISAGPVSVNRALDELGSDITELKTRYNNDSLKKNRESCTTKFGDVCPYYKTELCK